MPRTWEDIENYYSRLVDQRVPVSGMLSLVRQIRSSTSLPTLYPFTSMHDLHLLQLPPVTSLDFPFLKISPLYDGTIEFRYIDTHIEKRQWSRVVKDSDAFSRLERFVDQLHWITREKRNA